MHETLNSVLNYCSCTFQPDISIKNSLKNIKLNKTTSRIIKRAAHDLEVPLYINQKLNI